MLNFMMSTTQQTLVALIDIHCQMEVFSIPLWHKCQQIGQMRPQQALKFKGTLEL